MQLEEAKKFLKGKGIQHPELEVLKPSIDEYNVLLLQPKGDIEASKARVGHRDQILAMNQYAKFLEWAANKQTELVVAPEYSVPWNALIQTILAGHLPGARCLWALGCESITPAELDALEGRFKGKLRVIYEDFDRKAASKKVFLDPLAYIFHSKDYKGADCLVLLVQFKTHPSVDPERIEGDNLFCGNLVYVFGTLGKTIRFFSLICSDAFEASTDKLKGLIDRTMILHIQLNPDPRQSTYRTYRKYLFDYAKCETELICLNWASHVQEWKEDAGPKDWKNIGGTAWYLRPDKFDDSDQRVGKNHRAGLYYTRLKPMKWNVLFFNYEPAAFVLRASKVWHDESVPMVQSKRSGPRLQDVLRWVEGSAEWKSGENSVDGFEKLLTPYDAMVEPLKKLYADNPIHVERLLALTEGRISEPDNWYSVAELDSFAIDESEHVKRITFTQDPVGDDFRNSCVRHFVTCRGLLAQFTDWPPELSDLTIGYDFSWNEQYPHSNVVSNAGKRATLIYLGENRLEKELKNVGDKLRTALLRRDQPKNRLGIFHRLDGKPVLWLHPDSRRFDKPNNASSSEITSD